jgi:hypothetical protein
MTRIVRLLVLVLALTVQVGCAGEGISFYFEVKWIPDADAGPNAAESDDADEGKGIEPEWVLEPATST